MTGDTNSYEMKEGRCIIDQQALAFKLYTYCQEEERPEQVKPQSSLVGRRVC